MNILRPGVPVHGAVPLSMMGGVPAAVAADWWLGPWPNYPLVPPINPACAVGAYRAVNTPGTPWPGGPNVYNPDTLVNLAGGPPLIEGNGAVPWNILTGWGFVAALAQWLDTSITPVNNQTWTALCQFSGVLTASTILFGSSFGGAPPYFLVGPNYPAGALYGNGNNIFVWPQLLAGNLGIAAVRGYRNGVVEGVAIPPAVGNFNPLAIGASRTGAGAGFFTTANIESLWIGNCTLTPGQILALADPVLGAMPNL